MDRRDFVKTLGVIGASTLPGKKLYAEESGDDKEFVGILVDTTRCVGCQSCTEACAEANGLPEPDLDAIDGKNIDFLSPVDGDVVALNVKVIQSPEMINQDPYDKGWLIKVKSERFGANIKNLISGNVARAWIEDTVNKLSTSISGNYGVVLQDGGTITNGFVKELAPDNWEKVAGEFFLTNDV